MLRKRWWVGIVLVLAGVGLMASYSLVDPAVMAAMTRPAEATAIRSTDLGGRESEPLDDSRIGTDAMAAAANDVALPLPAPDAPLDAVIAELLPRAEAGEPRAACRLAFELLRCETLRNQGAQMLRTLNRRERRSDREGDNQSANRVAEEQIALLAVKDNCRALPAGLASRGSEFLYAAARAGHRESMLRFIAGEGLAHVPGAGNPLGAAAFIGHPHFAIWYREAQRVAEAMVARGDTAALFYLTIGYGGGDYDLFDARVPDDPVRYAAYRTVLSTTNGRPAPVMTDLTAAQQAQARQLSSEMLAGPFAGARFDREFLNRISHPGDSFTPDSVARCD